MLSWAPNFIFTVPCSRDNSPLAAADRPGHSENFWWPFASIEALHVKIIGQRKLPMVFHQRACVSPAALTQAVEKFWRYLPLTRRFLVCHQKIFFSLLHSIGIQLIPVEFWLRPHQWCQAAEAPLHHLHQWMMGRCLQI